VTDSYILPSASTSSTSLAGCPWLLFWEVLEAVRAVMGFSLAEDCEAGRAAYRLALAAHASGRLVAVDELCSRLSARTVCVVGSAATLRRDASLLDECDAIVAADGSTAFLISRGYMADVLVTDLDGPIWALVRAARLGALPLIYLHGDNYVHATMLAEKIFDRLAVSAQCIPGPYRGSPYERLVLPATGFTDGDRAAWLALCCGSRRLLLLGMETRAHSLAGTKTWLASDTPPAPAKKAKLAIAERLLQLALARAAQAG